MKHLKTHKIHPVYLRPGDTIGLDYSYEEPEGVVNHRYLTVDSVDKPMMIDTVIVYKTGAGAFGLKSGRVLVMGEDDGTYKDVPLNPGMKVLMGGRTQK
jgi:hypothetical protein